MAAKALEREFRQEPGFEQEISVITYRLRKTELSMENGAMGPAMDMRREGRGKGADGLLRRNRNNIIELNAAEAKRILKILEEAIARGDAAARDALKTMCTLDKMEGHGWKRWGVLPFASGGILVNMGLAYPEKGGASSNYDAFSLALIGHAVVEEYERKGLDRQTQGSGSASKP